MEKLLEKSPELPVLYPGIMVNGTVITIVKNKILVDIDGINTGIIKGKEAHDSTDTAKDLAAGDAVSAMVVEPEGEEGLTILSIKRAAQEVAWDKFEKAIEDGDIITVKPQEANKGGLLLEFDGIKAFIPVSQLAPLHYPRVNNADANEILRRLQELCGKNLKVKVIAVDREEGKLILSEKAAYEDERSEALDELKVGQKIQGEISGIVKFGIFVAFNGLEGLVHISEIAWGHVSNPNDYGKLGDKVEVLVIGIDDKKISLSMKRLTKDPWIEIAKKYKVGDVIKSKVTRLANFGAFIELEDGVNGLIHLSEIAWEKVIDPNKYLKMGQEIEVKVINIDLDEHRVGLSLRELQAKPAGWVDTEEEKKEKVEKTEKKPDTSDDPAKPLVDMGIPAKAAVSLADAGLVDPKEIAAKSKEELMELPGIGEKTAEKILEVVQA